MDKEQKPGKIKIKIIQNLLSLFLSFSATKPWISYKAAFHP